MKDKGFTADMMRAIITKVPAEIVGEYFSKWVPCELLGKLLKGAITEDDLVDRMKSDWSAVVAFKNLYDTLREWEAVSKKLRRGDYTEMSMRKAKQWAMHMTCLYSFENAYYMLNPDEKRMFISMLRKED